MIRKFTSIMVVGSFMQLTACGIWTGNISQPPPTADEWYQKPGVDRDHVWNDLKKCGYKRFDTASSNYEHMNSVITVDYCMADKGYTTQSRRTPADQCKNWRDLKLPICIARGGYGN